MIRRALAFMFLSFVGLDPLDEISAQLDRLRSLRCPTMKFGMDHESVARAVMSEVEEVLAESPGSALAQTEAAGVMAVAIHLAKVHGASPRAALRAEATRLRNRLDHIEYRGGTWAEAKVIERRPEALGLYRTVQRIHRYGAMAAAWWDGHETHVLVYGGTKAWTGARQAADKNAFWETVYGARARGYLAAYRVSATDHGFVKGHD